MKGMSTKRKNPAGEASGAQKPGTSLAERARKFKKRKRRSPVQEEARRQRRETTAPLRRGVNLGKTVLATLLWAMLIPVQITVIAPYISYPYVQGVVISIAVMSAILLHLWPTRTPQWRTLFWAFWITGAVGSITLYLGGGSSAVTVAALAASAFVFLRMNQNGRKLVGLIRDWRILR